MEVEVEENKTDLVEIQLNDDSSVTIVKKLENFLNSNDFSFTEWFNRNHEHRF